MQWVWVPVRVAGESRTWEERGTLGSFQPPALLFGHLYLYNGTFPATTAPISALKWLLMP